MFVGSCRSSFSYFFCTFVQILASLRRASANLSLNASNEGFTVSALYEEMYLKWSELEMV